MFGSENVSFTIWGDHDTHLDHDLSDIQDNVPAMCIMASRADSHTVPQFQYGPCQIIAKGMDHECGDGTRFTVLRYIPNHDWVPIFRSDNWMRVIDFCEPICQQFFDEFIGSRVYHYDASEWGISGAAWVYADGLCIEIDTQKPGYYLCIHRDDWQEKEIDALERILFTYGCMEQICGQMEASVEENEVLPETKLPAKWNVVDPSGVYEHRVVTAESEFAALWIAATVMYGCSPDEVDTQQACEFIRSLQITRVIE